MATERLQVYSCNVCGNVVEVLRGASSALVCCGKPMDLLVENTHDAAREKHVPVIEKTQTGVQVTVGTAAHPMEERHFIEWIELIADGRAYRLFLAPGDPPQAFFPLDGGQITARAMCNLHGLWKAQ